MKRYLLVLVLCGLRVAIAGEANNGTGLAEQNLTFAYRNMGKFIAVCLHTPVCRLTGKDREVLVFIEKSLPQEYEANPELAFTVDQSRFVEDQPAPRIAVTDNFVGARIYVNQKLLYPLGPDGKPQALSIAEGIAIVAHELGHHKDKILSHDYLDGLGTKVRQGYLNHSQRVKFPRYFMSKIHRADLTIESVNTALQPDFSNFLKQESTLAVLSDGADLFDLTAEVKKLPCPDAGGEIDSVFLDNIHWLRFSELGRAEKGPKVTLKAYSAAKVTCLVGGKRYHTWNYDLVLSLGFHAVFHPIDRTPWRFLPGSAQARFIQCEGTRNKHALCH